MANHSSQGGQFNYALKHTGFLGEAKMRAKRISQNPKYFLETLAKKSVEIVPLECPELEGFIDNLKNTSHFDKKESEMLKRKELAKKRSFLLNAATSPTIKCLDGEDLDYLRGNEESRDAGRVDHMIETFLAQIKSTDLTPIKSWISAEFRLKKSDLPYGMPKDLKLPFGTSQVNGSTNEALMHFIESASDDFLILDGEYQTKLEEITNNLQDNFDRISSWSLEDSALLSHIVSTVGDATCPSSFVLLNEFTSKLFPTKSRECIIAQKFNLKTKHCLEDKQASMVRGWIRDKEELQAKVNLAGQDLNKKHMHKMEQILNRKRQEVICQRWTDQLDKVRKEKCEKIRKLQITIEPVEKKRAEQIQQELENEEYRRAQIKLEVKKFEEKKLMQKLGELKKNEMTTNTLKEVEKIQAKKNKARVNFRSETINERMKSRKEAHIAMEREKQIRQAKLEATKEPVQIEYDPSNVIADTHATFVRRFETLKKVNCEDEEMVKFFRERYSFSTETILKDRRNRLEARLREAGLLDSSYARQVLLAMEPKPKPHLDSQIKFHYEP